MMKNAIADQNHGVIRPATSNDIVYRAFGRPYAGGPGQVINLFMSCSYPIGGYKLFFQREYGPDSIFTLMEQHPGAAPQLVTYYVADYTSGAGLATPVKFVTIKDAHGEHRVPVEPIG